MQTAVTGAFSPGGTGKFVLTGGTYTAASTNGNYSVINIRNNSAGNAILGNDFEVAGTGFAMFNMPGSAPVGAITQIGNLKIGNNQTAGVYRNAGNLQVLQVTSVTLTGGTSTFTSNPIGFGVSGTANLALGPISETAPANIVLAPGTNTAAGTGTIVLGAANTYTGTTTIPAGTTGTILLGAAGALPATTNLTVDAGTLDLNNNGASFDQTIASLSGAGGTITNSDSSNTRTLTVNETITTTFAGAVTGNLALTKELTGTLILSGANTYPGLTTVNGGTLLVHGSISGSVNLSGGTLGGNGTTGPVTVNTGGTLSPGDSPGILHVGNVQLNDQSTYAVELFGTTPGNDFDQLSVTGGVQINGQVALNVSLGTFDPLDFVDVFPIILNDLSDPVQGTFYSLPNGATFNVAGQDFIISYQDDASTPEFELTGGNDVSVMAVPEPGSSMLLIGGLLTIVGLGRRKES
jgi:fibronectin-binding autotransporter adhesin